MAKKQVTGIRIRGKIIWVTFHYKGIRFEESTGLAETKENLKRAIAKLERVKAEISFDELNGTNHFKFLDYFPNSKKYKRLFPEVAQYEKDITLKSYSEIWLKRTQDRFEAGEIKFTTFKSYKTGLKKLKDSKIYNLALKDINIVMLREYITQMSKKLSSKTVNNQLTPLRQIFEEASYEQIIPTDIMKNIKNPSVEKPEPVPFTIEEIERIFTHFKKHYPEQFTYVATLFYTGMRVGEALAMKWENFDFNKWTYHVKETRTEGRLTKPKTKASIRRIHIVKPLQKILKIQQVATMMKSDFVFLTGEGKPYHKAKYIIDKCWKPTLKILGIEYRDMYQLRHTHAIQSLIHGDNPHDVSKRLGHSSLQVTFSKYAKFLPEETKPSMLENVAFETGSTYSQELSQNLINKQNI